jgi:FkbM family methyltransferase
MDLTVRIASLGDKLPSVISRQLRSDSRLTRAIRPLVNIMLPNEPRIVTVIDGPAKGHKLMIFPREEKYYWTGLHEPHVQAAIAQYLRSGDSFWDIGAHIGFMSMIAAKSVGRSGEVHAFEPMTANRERLRRSIEANSYINIEIHAEAIGVLDGEAVLHSHGASLMWSLQEKDQGSDGEIVPCLTLESVAMQLETIPTLIKIDTEGVELDVLKGGIGFLREHHPIIIVEFTDEERLEAARHLLTDYAFSSLAANHWLLTPSS